MSLSELGKHGLDQQTELSQLNGMSQLIPDRWRIQKKLGDRMRDLKNQSFRDGTPVTSTLAILRLGQSILDSKTEQSPQENIGATIAEILDVYRNDYIYKNNYVRGAYTILYRWNDVDGYISDLQQHELLKYFDIAPIPDKYPFSVVWSTIPIRISWEQIDQNQDNNVLDHNISQFHLKSGNISQRVDNIMKSRWEINGLFSWAVNDVPNNVVYLDNFRSSWENMWPHDVETLTDFAFRLAPFPKKTSVWLEKSWDKELNTLAEIEIVDIPFARSHQTVNNSEKHANVWMVSSMRTFFGKINPFSQNVARSEAVVSTKPSLFQSLKQWFKKTVHKVFWRFGK